MYPFTRNFREYNWTRLTTVAWQDDPELVCMAHAHGVRVVANAGNLKEALKGPVQRVDWVLQMVKHIIAHALDGINFDLEEAAAPGSDVAKAYTQLVGLTSEVLHEVAPHSQVSVDVPWTPFDSDGRNYEWTELARHADPLFVMGYDMQAQIWGRCIASANDPFSLVLNGLKQWLYLVPASVLVLGVPWYGYDYECLNSDGQQDLVLDVGQQMQETCGGDSRGMRGGAEGSRGDVCELHPAEFRGAPCSDLVGAQRPIAELLQVMDSHGVGNVKWDSLQQAPYFNYAKDGKMHQVWFSNPESLALRYEMAAELGLKGVGAWNLEHLFSRSEAGITAALAPAGGQASPTELQMRASMWQAVETFFLLRVNASKASALSHSPPDSKVAPLS
ncbi:glycoside hydrolase superfamily [Dunaliella salina]|uniref:Glycoside hydrolase superfamily n=1 Tax=Dunaliella salina TaxID=3046 RepID=A0ABQ7G2D2_DUNSA|nr:glycoside hydrolase superfamily [Dunaliella salina]|eukprot:KAF5828765.1 glycoside hydrolase superfamily [Dunaliella salina]